MTKINSYKNESWTQFLIEHRDDTVVSGNETDRADIIIIIKKCVNRVVHARSSVVVEAGAKWVELANVSAASDDVR